MRRKHLFPTVLILGFAIPVLGPTSFFADRFADRGKIMPSVHQFLTSGGEERLKIWVYFIDHGEEDAAALQAALEEIELTDRALKRRRNRSRGPLIDARDLPVNKAYLDELRLLGLQLKRTSKFLNAVSATATAGQIRRLNELPFVTKIDRVHTCRRRTIDQPVQGIDRTSGSGDSPPRQNRHSAGAVQYGPSRKQLDQINVIPLHDSNYHGEGVLVAMLDTGFNRSHEALDHLDVVAEWDFIFEDSVTKNQPGDVSNQDSHGTQTLSSLGGYSPGNLLGPAWGASFILAKTERMFEEVEAEEDDFVRALEWAESLGAEVVSSSLGYFDWYTYEDLDGNTAVTTIASDIAAGKGVTVVTSAGNEGPLPWPGIIAPADGDSVIAVGAVDSFGVVVGFSSRGPSYDGRIKPDVMAMGYSVYVAAPYDSLSYLRSSGTSFSAPLVAGSVALLLQMHPHWTPVEVINALRNEASNSASENNDYGWGIIDAYASALHGATGVLEGVSLDSNVRNGRVRITVSMLNASGAIVSLQRREWEGAGENGWSPYQNIGKENYVDSVTPYIFEERLHPGAFQYRVQLASNPAVVSAPIDVRVPYVFLLGRSYPNPFIRGRSGPGQVTIPFTLRGRPSLVGESQDLSEMMDISLVIYDVRGKRVRVLEEGLWPPGEYVSRWNGLNESGIPVSSGVYYYKLSIEGISLTRKLVFLR